MSKIPEALSGAALENYMIHKGKVDEAKAMMDECTQDTEVLKADKISTESLIAESQDVDFITDASIRVNVITDRLQVLAQENTDLREIFQMKSMQFNRFVQGMEERLSEIHNIQLEVEAWIAMEQWHRAFLNGTGKGIARPKLGPKQKAVNDQLSQVLWTMHEQEKSDD